MIDLSSYPKQGFYLNQKCIVIFNYNSDLKYIGTVIRDDSESPFLTVIRLDDGKVILSTECQFQLV